MIRAARIALDSEDSDRRGFRRVSPSRTIRRANGFGEPSDFAAGLRLPHDRLRAACRCRAGALVAAARGGRGDMRCEGLLVSRRGASRRTCAHRPAYPVEVVDTTGCGDVFHGVYAATLARGFDLAARIRWASAAAAIKATACGGQSGIPTG